MKPLTPKSFSRHILFSGLMAISLATLMLVSSTSASLGVTWTARTGASNNRWTAVTFGGPAGQELFVAVASNGTNDQVMTSPDGITWTSQTTPAVREWIDVKYLNGLFVSVAVRGTPAIERVMTSPDGITWTVRNAAAENEWQSVAFGNGGSWRLRGLAPTEL